MIVLGSIVMSSGSPHKAGSLRSKYKDKRTTSSDLPSISLTSSTGSSSYLLHSIDSEDSSSASSRSSLNRIASRASDIQSYASRYLDSIRSKSSKSRPGSAQSSPRSTSPNLLATATSSRTSAASPVSGAGSLPYLLTFRQNHRLTPHSTMPTSHALKLPPRPYSLTPSPPPSSSRAHHSTRWI